MPGCVGSAPRDATGRAAQMRQKSRWWSNPPGRRSRQESKRRCVGEDGAVPDIDDLDMAILRALASMPAPRSPRSAPGVAVGPRGEAPGGPAARGGVIRGFTVRLHLAALGWHTEAFVEVYCQGSTSPARMRARSSSTPRSSRRAPSRATSTSWCRCARARCGHLEQVVERLRRRAVRIPHPIDGRALGRSSAAPPPPRPRRIAGAGRPRGCPRSGRRAQRCVTTMTGHCAWCSTAWLVDPSSSPANPHAPGPEHDEVGRHRELGEQLGARAVERVRASRRPGWSAERAVDDDVQALLEVLEHLLVVDRRRQPGQRARRSTDGTPATASGRRPRRPPRRSRTAGPAPPARSRPARPRSAGRAARAAPRRRRAARGPSRRAAAPPPWGSARARAAPTRPCPGAGRRSRRAPACRRPRAGRRTTARRATPAASPVWTRVVTRTPWCEMRAAASASTAWAPSWMALSSSAA